LDQKPSLNSPYNPARAPVFDVADTAGPSLGEHKMTIKPHWKMGLNRSAAAIVVALVSSPSVAQDIASDTGSSERVSLAAELGVLSVDVTTAACNISAGIAPEDAVRVMGAAADRYRLLDNALVSGDPDLGITAQEIRPQTLAALTDMRDKWAEFEVTAKATTPGLDDQAEVTNLARWDGQIRQDAVTLLSEIIGTYADSILLLQTDAMFLQLVANQQLNIARISRNTCLFSAGVRERKSLEELADRFAQFETSLAALRNGMESLSVAPPPTPEIEALLTTISAHWNQQRDTLSTLINTSEITEQQRANVFVGLDDISADLRELSALYVANSKLSL
jgi:hypothetical protein